MRIFYGVLAVLSGVSPKIYTPCDVAYEISNIRVQSFESPGKTEPLQCSRRDIGRLVCVASLHGFDTEYSRNVGNETYVGIFGIPKNKSRNVSSIAASQKDFVRYQMSLRFQNLTAVSEVICNYFQWFTVNYLALTKFWNKTVTADEALGSAWKKRVVSCVDHKLQRTPTNVFVVDERFARDYYKPGALKDFAKKKPENVTVDDDFFEKPCHGEFYCGDAAQCLGKPDRPDKGRMERKVERLARVVDWTVIALWFVVVVGGLSWGYWYVRNPRRQGRHNDDWGRPILTAHFNS